MGAWGSGSFDNDSALDWLYELKGSDDLSVVVAALSPEPDEDGYLDTDGGCLILAAGEVVAALLNKPAADLPDEVAAWVAAHKTLDAAPLRATSCEALDRVLGADSELEELWAESEDVYEEWKAKVQDLRARLAP